VNSIYEIVMNGTDEKAIQAAMKAGIRAAAESGMASHIGASNFDGRLGPHRFSLHELFR
jgi:formylmethanofuran--tetrahydromethanopterin N-formyltransferase